MLRIVRETFAFRPVLAIAALTAGLSATAHAAFPERPVSLIVPVAPGGTMDIAGRALANLLKDELGTTVIVENKPGGSGNIAYGQVARAKADGYTLLFSYEGFHTGNPAITPDLQWDPKKSFEPIAEITRAPHVVLVPKDSEVKDLKGLVEFAAKNPGYANFGSSGIGSIQHLGAELFAQIAGVQLMHIPYNGAAPALQDLLANRIHLFITTPPTVMGHIKGGNVRALALTAQNRAPSLPDVPTTAEQGYPEFQLEAWFSLFAPAGLPEDVKVKLVESVRKVVEGADFKKAMVELGAVASYQGPEDLAAIVERDLAKWDEVVRKSENKTAKAP